MRLRQIFKFSSRKFFQIIESENLNLIPDVPEDAILTKYLSSLQKSSSPSPHSRQLRWAKEKQQKLDYSQLLNGSPFGSVESFTHRNCELTLVSTNYYRIDEAKLHKIIRTSKPDVIVVQRRPDYHIHDFNLLPKGADGVFSDREYLNQLYFTAAEVQEPKLTARPMLNVAIKSKQDQLEQNPQKQILQEKGFEICRNYSASYSQKLLYGEMPARSYRQWVANTHTLMQLQQIFKVVCQRLPRYPRLNFTPYKLATLTHAQNFMRINDMYMSTLIEMLIASQKHRRILGIFGIVENQAIRHLLTRDLALQPIINCVIPPKPKSSLVRDIEPLEIIEKHILLDVMFYGRQVTEVKTQHFHTTNAIVQKYGESVDKRTMMKFRYDKVMEYLGMMDQKIKMGEEEIKKQFVRETLRKKD